MSARAAGEGPWLQGPLAFRGRAEIWRVESRVLAGNRAGDPHLRELPVYLPPGPDEPLPLVLLLTGFTGRGHYYLETHPWKRGVALRYEELVLRGEAPRAILAMPDCFTRLGGSQYVNSSFLGRYEDHLADELVPFLEARYAVAPGRRGVVGKSSGGFGALHLAMRRPGLFAAAASISGDCCFELCYAQGFPSAWRGLLAHGMDPARFLEAFARDPRLEGQAFDVLNLLAMSACYSPDPESPLGFRLPIELETGELVPEVWERWLAFDPLRACERHAAALGRLELLHLECGLQDEFHLQLGLRRLVRRLRELGVAHRHEEHPAGHRDIDHRTLGGVALVARALAAPARPQG